MLKVLNTHLRENFLLLLVALLTFNQEPLLAQEQEYQYNLKQFISPLKVARGTLNPETDEGLYLTKEDSCHLVTTEWGWLPASCSEIDQILISTMPEIDTILIETPNSEGFVKFDDWYDEDKDDEIETIWEQLVEGAEQQSKRLGENITAERWHVYPTLNDDENIMYYATLLKWGDDLQMNIKASKFDRSGYVTFMIVPTDSNISAEDVEKLVLKVMSSYSSNLGQRYSEFSSGDKIAAVGAVGVLAALVGAKYSKGALAGLMGILLLLVKKAWFLLILPFVWLNKHFKKRKDQDRE